MGDIGRRFEVLGKAGVGGRGALAAYELAEIEETFVGVLPRAEPPKEGDVTVLDPLAATFVGSEVPRLRRAIGSGAGFEEAFQAAAVACNTCHEQSGHAFIEVSPRPGDPVPVVTARSPG